ncbi:MAG: hypothetical protein K8L99_04100 [Anaerolineae bacterium]|nr:hypothetical protein [Anaerolineae bacterium]
MGGPNRGRAVVRLLPDRLNYPKNPPQVVKMPATLHIRELTGPPDSSNL